MLDKEHRFIGRLTRRHAFAIASTTPTRLIWLQRKPSRTSTIRCLLCMSRGRCAREMHESTMTYLRTTRHAREGHEVPSHCVQRHCFLREALSYAFEIHSPAWQQRDQWRRCARRKNIKMSMLDPSKCHLVTRALCMRPKIEGNSQHPTYPISIPLTRARSNSKWTVILEPLYYFSNIYLCLRDLTLASHTAVSITPGKIL